MRMIRRGEVRVNGKRAKVNLRLSDGDRVRVPPVLLEEERCVDVPPWMLDIVREQVIHEDSRLLAVNKPSGIAVHRGTSVPIGLVDAVRSCFNDDNIQLGHRIDRDTSGCVLFAKTRVALLELHHAIQHHRLVKTYEGIVAGRWPKRVTEISVPLRKIKLLNDELQMEVHSDGKAAISKFEILRSTDQFTWLQIQPVTGRKHQIRVHCQYQGHPIIGDNKYDNREWFNAPNMLLHATNIRFPDGLSITAPIPACFNEFWQYQTQAD